MEFKEKNNMIYLENEEGNIVAKVTFPDVKAGVVNINHTFVDDSLRGQGVAGKLLEAAYKKLKAENKKVIPTCSYAVTWFEKNDDCRDILE
jgi:predicted GNAT family acetyltransferase